MKAIEFARGEVGKCRTWWGKIIFVGFWLCGALSIAFWVIHALFNPTGDVWMQRQAWAILMFIGVILLSIYGLTYKHWSNA